MKYRVMIMACVVATMSLVPAVAYSKSKGANCPPGLMKKSPRCIPPGQAKKYGYNVGNRLPNGDYDYIRDPSRYRLPRLGRGESYYRIGDNYLRIDRETREVLELIDAIGAVLN